MHTVPEAAATVKFDTAWTAAVTRVSALAQAKLPESLHGRIQRATALVLGGAVCMEEDGRCQVRASDGVSSYAVNGHCTCEDAQHAPEGYCKHRLAKALYLRAGDLLRETVTLDLDEITAEATRAPQVPAQYVVQMQGKVFVKFAGLLAMAHARGLVELTAHWTFNDASLSLAEAVATFADGRHFREAGDATPDNVSRTVAPHFRRLALTRAKARCLRDALGIHLTAVEELGEA
jgi:hypothetical protein